VTYNDDDEDSDLEDDAYVEYGASFR